jgi:large repetitive protein
MSVTQTVTTTYTITIASPLTITNPNPPNGVEGKAYSFQFQASGGTPPYTWTGSSIPPGLTLSSGGLLSGTPTSSGQFTFNVTVTDAGT